jgi:hypothetical protein
MRKLLIAALAVLSFNALAQNRPADLQPLPAPPPPPPGMTDDALEPQVTIVKRGDDKIEEFRVNGKLYMQKITPSHGVPYVLIDERGDGSWARRDITDSGLRVPQWVVRTW